MGDEGGHGPDVVLPSPNLSDDHLSNLYRQHGYGSRVVKKVVRRSELLKGHRHGFRFQACS